MTSSDASDADACLPDSAHESVDAGETDARPAEQGPTASAESAPPPTTPSEGKSLVAPSAATSQDAAPDGEAKSMGERARLSMIPFVAPQQRAQTPPPNGAAFWRVAFDKRLQIGAIAAGLAIVGTVAAAAISYRTAQDQSLMAQNSEAQNLADTVKTLKAKLGALEAARHDEITDLRKTVAELKGGLAAAHDSSAALGQVNARADRLEHDEAAKREELADLRKTVAELKSSLAAAHDSGANLAQFNARADRLEHDEDARIEKLGERVDHDAATRAADLTARLDKLEKKATTQVVAAIPAPPAAPAVLTKQPTVLPPVVANVSNETTGSIAPPRTPIRGWAVREIHGGVAIIEGPYGYRQIALGDKLPGIGRVLRIERTGSGLSVVTDQGIISGSYGASAYHAGPYGAFNGGYGPPEGEF